MEYRALTVEEIKQLEAQRCTSNEWENLLVSWPAENNVEDLKWLNNVSFSGNCRLGRLQKSFKLDDVIELHSGIYNARLHNITVGDNCYISDIGEYIANYDIADDVLIQDVGLLAVLSKSSFGNGTAVCVLSETGGREVVITDRLSSHIAYIMALYRHRPALHQKLSDIANYYAKKYASERGAIGKGVTIRRCSRITNVKIGEGATIMGSHFLHNGSINSNLEAPCVIGSGVIAEDFIIQSGSSVVSNAMISRCFVGQACKLAHSYSATDSLFFANCHGENGEACSIFAGPFTVTHHKSTLLIAGLFSFMNAGSGSNQSNHMYKLGPIHQGILERGAKTSSDSYILWPSRVGAFSLVMGRHVTHSDTSNLPFSYLIEQNNTTYLVPGVNLRSVGTIRDAQKWPNRDKRKDGAKLDYINYDLLSPYTVQKMFKGLDSLKKLIASSGELSDIYSFHSTKITNSELRKGIKYYNTGITKYLGNLIISRLQVGGAIGPVSKFAKVYSTSLLMQQRAEKLKGLTIDEKIRQALKLNTTIEGGKEIVAPGSGDWTDIAGLFAPKTEIIALIEKIESGEISKLREINAQFNRIYESYYEWEWNWAYPMIEEFFGVEIKKITAEQTIEIIEKWRAAVISLDKEIYNDAHKEFSLASMTGFGADGDRRDKEADFEQVRGDFESNSVVKMIHEHIYKKSNLADEVIRQLK